MIILFFYNLGLIFFVVLAIMPIGNNNTVLAKLPAEIWECCNP